jgi:DNA-binding NtrC family response regulator
MKIAIVDDEEDLLTELSELIAGLGHEPVPIGDPRQAAGIIVSDPAIRLAFVDLLMPAMSGTEVIAALRPLFAMPRRLHVIGMTGHGSVNDLCRFTDAGAIAIMLKPFLAAEVGQKISNYLAEDTERQETQRLGSVP